MNKKNNAFFRPAGAGHLAPVARSLAIAVLAFILAVDAFAQAPDSRLRIIVDGATSVTLGAGGSMGLSFCPGNKIEVATDTCACPTGSTDPDGDDICTWVPLCANVAPPGYANVVPMQNADPNANCYVPCNATDSENQTCPDGVTVQSRTRSQGIVGGTCQWQSWSAWSPVTCPVLCTGSEVEEQTCPDGIVVQVRVRSQANVGGVCQWQPWSAWSPATCPNPCASPQTDRRFCPDGVTVQSRTRSQLDVGGVCQWQPWSAWSPAPCPTGCANPETESQTCPDGVTMQSRTRSQVPVGGVCQWQPWSDWSPSCPVNCASPETEEQTCPDGVTVQSRTRSQANVGGVCQWQAWSDWDPDCPSVWGAPMERQSVHLQTRPALGYSDWMDNVLAAHEPPRQYDSWILAPQCNRRNLPGTVTPATECRWNASRERAANGGTWGPWVLHFRLRLSEYAFTQFSVSTSGFALAPMLGEPVDYLYGVPYYARYVRTRQCSAADPSRYALQCLAQGGSLDSGPWLNVQSCEDPPVGSDRDSAERQYWLPLDGFTGCIKNDVSALDCFTSSDAYGNPVSTTCLRLDQY